MTGTTYVMYLDGVYRAYKICRKANNKEQSGMDVVALANVERQLITISKRPK